MGVLKRGILGGFRGKVANVVGTSWKSIDVIKSLPTSVANPNTPAQQAQRTKLTSVVGLGQTLAGSLLQGWFKKSAVRMSAFNMFVKTNIGAFSSLGVFIPANFVTQRGNILQASYNSTVADASDNTIAIDWTGDPTRGNMLDTDTLNVTYYNETQDYWVSTQPEVTRVEGTIIITDEQMATSDVLRVYLGFQRADASLYDNNVYQSVTVQA